MAERKYVGEYDGSDKEEGQRSKQAMRSYK